MSLTQNLTDVLASFDKTPGDLEGYEVMEEGDFIEWMEKTNGDIHEADRLQGLPIDLPSPQNPGELAGWRDYATFDPTNLPDFRCANCAGEFRIVETTTGKSLGALDSRGILGDFTIASDSAGSIYNYEFEKYPDSQYSHVCDECADILTGGRFGTEFASTIRHHSTDGIVDVGFQPHVAHRPDAYFLLDRNTRNAIDSIVTYDGSPDGWVKVYPEGGPDPRTAHERQNIRNWISNWATIPERELVDYYFDFPSLVVQYVTGQARISGCVLYVPDDPVALSEAREWIAGPASEYRP